MLAKNNATLLFTPYKPLQIHVLVDISYTYTIILAPMHLPFIILNIYALLINCHSNSLNSLLTGSVWVLGTEHAFSKS